MGRTNWFEWLYFRTDLFDMLCVKEVFLFLAYYFSHSLQVVPMLTKEFDIILQYLSKKKDFGEFTHEHIKEWFL